MTAQIDAPLRRRLTALDSSFLYNETANSPLHIGALQFYEGHLPFEKVFDFVAKRIHLIPRYRQRLAEVPLNLGHATLEDDPDFKLENHIIRCSLREGLSEGEMLGEVLKTYHAQMDRSRPLWDIMWFGDWPGGKTLIVSRNHHALIDGVSGIELTKILADFEPNAPDPPPPTKEWNPAALPTPVERVIAATRDQMISQVESVTSNSSELVTSPAEVAARAQKIADGMRKLAASASRPMASTPWTAGPVGGDRALAWIRMSFGEFRGIRNALGGTVNDIVLAILSEGAARYLAHRNYPKDGFFRIGCPVNVRRAEEQTELGNRVSMMFPMVPAAPMDAVARLKAVREETEQIKHDELPQIFERISSLMEFAPASMMSLMSRAGTFGFDVGAALVRMTGWKPTPGGLGMPAMGVHFVATNVPGVQVSQYMAGHKCLDQIGLFPLGGNMGYGVAIASYYQNLYIAMMAEPTLIPDVEMMKTFVEESFADLKRAAESAGARKKSAA